MTNSVSQPFPSLRARLLAVPAVLCTLFATAAHSQTTDLLDVLLPGRDADVLFAGLSVPSSLTSIISSDRPLSLPDNSSGTQLSYTDSQPWEQSGRQEIKIGGSTISEKFWFSEKAKGGNLSVLVFHDESQFDASEKSKGVTTLSLDGKDSGAALAWRGPGFAFGLSLSRNRTEGGLSSDRIWESDTNGTGIISMNSNMQKTVLESRIPGKRAEPAFRFSYHGGSAWFSTVSGDNTYHIGQSLHSLDFEPSVLVRNKNVRQGVVFRLHRWSSSGPAMFGQLESGHAGSKLIASSYAYLRVKEKDCKRSALSFEYSGSHANVSGSVGGFLIPGIFGKPYSSNNDINLDTLNLRYGKERTMGKLTLQSSLMLTRGKLSGTFYAARSRFFRPPIVLVNERIDNATLILAAPSIGLGYRTGNWSIDGSLTGLAGWLSHGFEEYSTGNNPSQVEERQSNKIRPSYRFMLSVRRSF